MQVVANRPTLSAYESWLLINTTNALKFYKGDPSVSDLYDWYALQGYDDSVTRRSLGLHVRRTVSLILELRAKDDNNGADNPRK